MAATARVIATPGRSGVALHQLVPSFSCPCKKTEAITPRRDRLQTPVSRLILRVPSAVGRAETRPPSLWLQRTQTVAASFSPADGMLGAGQREIQNQNPKNCFQAPFEGRPQAHFRQKKNPTPPMSSAALMRIEDPPWCRQSVRVTPLTIKIELGEGQDVMSCPWRKELEWNPLTAIEGS